MTTPAEDDQLAPGEDFAEAAGVDPSPQDVATYQSAFTEDDGAAGEVEVGGPDGIAPERLDDEDLLRELGSLHRTRHDTLRHGSDDSLAASTERLQALEGEYLRRFPEREVDPERLRDRGR